MKLSVRARAAIEYAIEDQFWWRDLKKPTDDRNVARFIAGQGLIEMRRVPNCGKVTIKELEKWVKSFGFKLWR